MKTSIITLLLLGAGLVLFQSNPALGACNPKCKQGQTCRFEQPNTYYCQNINGVQGSQQSSMGAANSNAMQPRGGFDPRGSGGYGPKQGSSGSMASSGSCAGVSGACVSVTINGYETSYRSVEEASIAILQQSLAMGYVVNASVSVNDSAASEFSISSRYLGDFFDRLSSYRFVDRPEVQNFREIQSMLPPISDRMLNMGLDKQIAQLAAQFGYQAMQAMMQKLKDIAIGSGGSFDPLSGTALALYGIGIAGTALALQILDMATSGPSPTDQNGDFDGDGIPNYADPDKDGDGVDDYPDGPDRAPFDPNSTGSASGGNSIIAEKDAGMMLSPQVSVYNMLRDMQQMFYSMQNPFFR